MIRTQLSLYVPQPTALLLEATRLLLDPLQAALIPAHVTLCRENELANLGGLDFESMHPLASGPISLGFGDPEAFGGHGILLPCVDGIEQFQALRQTVLGDEAVANPVPHITLAHPRNPRAPDNDLSNARHLAGGLTITFDVVSLIQQDQGSAWEVVRTFDLRRAAP